MAGDFLSTQAAVYESTAASWERWTIDEIDEDVARVLVAHATRRAWIASTAAQILAETTTAIAKGRGLTEVVRDQAMAAELEPASDVWSDEVAAFASLTRLQRFLNRRRGKPGLPSGRPLREGDVFWIVVPGIPAEPSAGTEVIPPSLFAERIDALEVGRADVWDVTAAARQAAKASYSRTVRKSDEADAEWPDG